MSRFVDFASDGRRAYPIVRALFDGIVDVLRSDPRIRGVASRTELELLVADAHREAEIQIARELRGRVHLADLGEDQ